MIERLKSRNWLSDLFLLATVLAIFYSLFLSYRPLAVPDEARYAEIPREMVALHNYVTPHLDGIKYFEKPALFYWLQAGAIKLWGASQGVIRIPNVCMALLGCLIVYSLGRTLYNRRTGLIASLILATSGLYFILGQQVTLDMTLSTLITASLACFIIATKKSQDACNQLSIYSRSRHGSQGMAAIQTAGCSRFLYYGFYICSALAVLTKGLVGFFLPTGIIGLWILFRNDWGLLKKIYLPTGILLFLAVASPWHLLVQWHNPEFLRFYFWDQQFARYFTDIADRYEPIWFFLPVIALGFIPWICFLPQSLYFNCVTFWKNKTHESHTFFILLWVALIFVFFSISQSKLIPYILPLFPPLSILAGRYLANFWDAKQISRGVVWGYFLLFFLILSGTIALFFVIQQINIPLLMQIQKEINLLKSLWLAGTALAALCILQRSSRGAFLSLALCSLVAYQVVTFTMPKIDTRSIQSLAIVLKPLLQPDDQVAVLDTYYQDLPFYLQRKIIIVNWQNELNFGFQHQDDAVQWMLNENEFWPVWESTKQVYLLMDIDLYHALAKKHQYQFYLLAETQANVLLSNHPITQPLFYTKP